MNGVTDEIKLKRLTSLRIVRQKVSITNKSFKIIRINEKNNK